jgi:hypothetical protein
MAFTSPSQNPAQLTQNDHNVPLTSDGSDTKPTNDMASSQVVFPSCNPDHLLPLEKVFDVFGCLPCRVQ